MIIKQFQTCVFFNKQNSQFTFQQILQQVHVLVNHSSIKKIKNKQETISICHMILQKKKIITQMTATDKTQYELIAVSIRHVSSDTL